MIRLTTLGAARVHRGDVELLDLPAQRLRFALLVYLASEKEAAREDVVAMFWPDRDTARGRHALRQMLYELRGVLGDDWVELRRDRIVCSALIDVADFERAADEGRAADALACYGGGFLSGFAFDHAPFEGWAERRRAHLARLHRRLQREHIAALVAAGRTEEAVSAARRWVELDPLDDEAAHTLIERLYHAGQRTAALQYFDSYQRQLAAELQVEPIEPTLELVARIRSGEEPAASLPAVRSASAAEETLNVPQATSSPPRSTPHLLNLWRMHPRVAAAALMTLVIAGIVTGLLGRAPGAASPAELPRTLRVAVLAPESSDSLNGMANELAEQLTAALGQSSMLEVVATKGIALRMEGAGATVDSIGRLLGADYLVGGSLVRTGDAVGLNVELFDGRDSRVLRTESLRRPLAESPTLVTDAVARLAIIVREELGTQLEIRRYRSGTPNPRAYELMLEGKGRLKDVEVLFRAGELDAAIREVLRADTLFAIAERSDPRWATPLEQRARARSWQAFFTALRDSSELRRILREGLIFADRAISLDDESAGAHEIRGMLLTELLTRSLVDPDSTSRIRAAAEASFERAIALEPNRQMALQHLAEFHLADGKNGLAIVSARRGYRADPFSSLAAPLLQILFAASFEAGDDAEAESWCRTGRDKFPNAPPFRSCLFELHAWGSVEPEPDRLRLELDRIPPSVVNVQPYLLHMFEAQVGAAYARAGLADSARAVLARIPPLPSQTDELVRAAVYVQLGDRKSAIELLKRYLELPGAETTVLMRRQFRKLHRDPEFQRLVGRDA